MSHLLGQCKSLCIHTEIYYYYVSSFSVPTCYSGHQRTSGLLRAHKCVLCADIHLREEEVACHFIFLCHTHLKKKKSKATIDLWIFRSEHNSRRGNIMQHNIGYITEHTWKFTTEAWIEMEITLDRVLIRKDTIQGKCLKIIWSETLFTVKEIEILPINTFSIILNIIYDN